MKTRILLLIIIVSLPYLNNAQIQKGGDIDGEAPFDESGYSVSMPDAVTIAIGAIKNDGIGNDAGQVRIYQWNGTSWVQKGVDIDGEAAGDFFGHAVSMADSNTVAIGSQRNDGNGNNAGHVRVYKWNGNSWTQKGTDLDGEVALDQFGSSVCMPDSNTVAIGAVGNDGNGSSSGHVRIYSWNGSVWVQKGSDIDGESAGDNSGASVSMSSSNVVAIGAGGNNGNGALAGHVRIYEWNGSAWNQKGGDIDGEAPSDFFGSSVSMANDNTVAIGANGNDGNGANAGHVRVYVWNGSAWVQKGGDIDGEAAGDFFGSSVSMANENTVAIGANGNDDNGANAGHVRVYVWSGSAWIQQGFDIDGEASGDFSGFSVSMSDTSTLSIGAYSNDGNGNNSGQVRVYNFCSPILGTDVQIACDSFTWLDGNTYNANNNTASFNIVGGAANGCDSLVTLDLTIINSASGTDTRTECNSYTWIDGNNYTASNNTASFNIVGGAANGCDSLITLDLTIINSAFGTDTITACNSYTWIDGNTYTANNNTATFNIVGGAANGCDSLVTLVLTINSVSDITTSTSGITITANNAGATYQWLECDNNYAVINGETGQSFTALVNGNYAVELTENGCVDTSTCVAITSVSIIENSFGNELLIYPNPTSGNFSIDLGSIFENSVISITDISGKLVESKTITQSQVLNLSINEPEGVYILSVKAGDKKAVIRLVKE
jgi:hypothetical protein